MSLRSPGGSAFGPKPTKACVNCRRSKIKCIVEDGASSCRRCDSNSLPCNFIPRANAAGLKDILEQRTQTAPTTDNDAGSVQARLAVIEAILGIQPAFPGRKPSEDPSQLSPTNSISNSEDPSFQGIWAAAQQLKSMKSKVTDSSHVWSRDVITQLWASFHDNHPGLHFLSQRQTFTAPTPLLLASILYCSALQHAYVDVAALASDYFIIMCDAIAAVSVPSKDAVQDDSPSKEEQTAFQNTLGLVLAGLACEAFVDKTGIWISTGYRIFLDYCPVDINEQSPEWTGLFTGLQTIDLEHASLHLSCPIVPRQAPLPSLLHKASSTDDPYRHLTEMMHVGLSHFIGRGLPTIYQFIRSTRPPKTKSFFPFTENDSKFIRQWAKQLDEWLVTYTRNSSQESSIMIFRQYVLHRLFVLSIYHPARGFNLFAHNVTSAEPAEFLVSARAALRLQLNDHTIWGNWDLTMITWAALLVIQGIQGGSSEPQDLQLIQTHLLTLQNTNQPAPSLRHQLLSRLESSLQAMHTPPGPNSVSSSSTHSVSPIFPAEESWALFDQNSIATWQQHPEMPPVPVSATNNAIVYGTATRQNLGTAAEEAYAGAHGAVAGNVEWSTGLLRFFGNPGYDIGQGS